MATSQDYLSLSKKNSIPYYVQIKYYLRELIGTLPTNSPIPSELELAKKFNVSRGTVKQAIMDLVYEGLLYREQGKGTFISSHIQRDYASLPSFTKDIRKLGHDPHVQLLGFELTTAAPRAQRFFKFSTSESVYKYKRLIFLENSPIAVVTSFLNPQIFPQLVAADIGSSLYESLNRKYEKIPTQATDSYSTAAISPKTAKLLCQPKDAIVIYSERMATLSDGSPCEFVESYIRHDHFKIQISFRQNNANEVLWEINR